MAISSKPALTFGEGVRPVTHKARQSQNNNLPPGMHLDGFARVLEEGGANLATLTGPAAPQPAQGINMAPEFQYGGYNFTTLQGAGINLGQPGVGSLQDLGTLQKVLQNSSTPLHTVNTLNALQGARPQGLEARVLAVHTNSHKAKTISQETVEYAQESLGKLSSIFESGRDGAAAIGYDRTGGTSYGKYQIASKTGTMEEFLKFLDIKAPELGKQLRAAGPADTGSRSGGMPETWKKIAKEQPENFEQLQHEFITQKHFVPAVKMVNTHTGLVKKDLTPTLQEVLFSTAVQHGPAGAAKIVARAMEKVDKNSLLSSDQETAKKAEQDLIRNIYDIRSGQFGSSTAAVREAVQNRLKKEMSLALDMQSGIKLA